MQCNALGSCENQSAVTSRSFLQFVEQAREHYDLVIIRTPPMMISADALYLRSTCGFCLARHPVEFNAPSSEAHHRLTARGQQLLLGAHAGFTKRQLMELCAEAFGSSSDVSGDYYLARYREYQFTMKWLINSGLCHRAFPSVYVYGHQV